MALTTTILLIATVAGVFYFIYKIKLRKLYSLKKTAESKLVELNVLLNYSKENEKAAKEETKTIKEFYIKLLTMLNHEIRNPLNGVSGMTELLSQTPLSSEQSEFIETIRKGNTDLKTALDHIFKSAGVTIAEHKEKPDSTGQVKHLPLKFSNEFAEQYPLKILIAEDDPMNQQLAMMVLKRLGYEPQLASNGKEVLEKVSESSFDLVFMDVQMPEMDGLEATKMLRISLTVQPVIIAMTANAMEGDKEACIEAGMDDYISKPVNLEDLVGKLQKTALIKRAAAI